MPLSLAFQSQSCMKERGENKIESEGKIHVSSLIACPWDFPGKNTGVGCHFLLQGIFQNQGSNLGVLHCRQILYLSYKGRLLVYY